MSQVIDSSIHTFVSESVFSAEGNVLLNTRSCKEVWYMLTCGPHRGDITCPIYTMLGGFGDSEKQGEGQQSKYPGGILSQTTQPGWRGRGNSPWEMLWSIPLVPVGDF